MEPAEVESLLEIEDSSGEAWCSVFQGLISNQHRIDSPEMAEIVCHALLRKVEDIGCMDEYCVDKIIDIIAFWLNASQNFQSTIYFNIVDEDDCHLHKTFKRRDRTNLLFSYGIYDSSRLLQLSLMKSQVKVIRLLINYGFVPPIDVYNEDSMKDASNTICLHRFLGPKLTGHVCTFECGGEFEDRLQLLYPDKFTYVRGCENLLQRGFKRILLTALCIRVLENRITNNSEEYVQCLRLYFRSVTDPFVQADELGGLLRFFLFDVSEDYVDEMVQYFKRLYPESQGPYKPRSLQHLCRCAIRQNLNDRSDVLPVLLDKLGFPDKLKMYVMGNS